MSSAQTFTLALPAKCFRITCPSRLTTDRSWIKTVLPVCGTPPPELWVMKAFSMYIRLSTLGRLNSLICRRKSGHLFREKPSSFAPDVIPSSGLNPISLAIASGKVLYSSAFGGAELGKMHTGPMMTGSSGFRLMTQLSSR